MSLISCFFFVFQMSKEIETTKMMQMVEIAKCNLLVGLKESDRSICNFKLGK